MRIRTIVALIVIGFGGTGWLRAGDGIRIEKSPAKTKTVYFDPKHRPSDMPKLSRDEAAVTRSMFGAGTSVEVEVASDRDFGGEVISTVRILGVEANIALDTVIWLPEKPEEYLVLHEKGHQRISEMFYRDAEKTMRKLAARHIGQTVRGRGPNADAARSAAMRKVIDQVNAEYMEATQVPSARVNAIFDKITAHGRNKRVSVEEGIRQALEQYYAEQKKE